MSSKFNQYARKADAIAKDAFEKYSKTKKAYGYAKDRMDSIKRNTVMDFDGKAKLLRAQADFAEAEKNMKDAQKIMAQRIDEFKSLRSELQKELHSEYMAKPDSLDANTMELLKSGILKPHEYEKLMQDAINNNNYTMQRIIGDYAGKESDALLSKNGHGDPNAVKLMNVAMIGKTDYAGAYLEAFDSITFTYNRCSENDGMISHWDELVGDTVESF